VETPTRILFIHHALNHPEIKWVRGPTRCLRDLLSHLDRSRFEPIVLCNDPVISELAATGATVHAARDWTASRGRVSLWWMREIRRLVRRYGVRLIHVDEYMQNATVVPVARAMRVPLVTQLHRVPTSDERRWALLHQSDLVVGASRACIDGLLADGVPPERAVVIYNAVDPERLARGDASGLRTQLGIGHTDVVVTLVAYFVSWKAIDVALRAFRALREIRQDCHFVLCGDGPDRGALEAQADALGIRPWTHFLGDRRDVGAVLRDATDILVSTSRSESFNLTLAEAGVFGLPVLATDIPAHREVLADGDAGWLVPTDNVGAFTEALAMLASDEQLRVRYGTSLRRRVEELFLIDRHAIAYQDAYTRMLARPAATYGWVRATRWPPLYTAWIRERLSNGVARLTGGGRH
jgi:glycosyltransferase involved in cell wall biosynthesis